MAIEDAFNAAQSVTSMFGTFFNTVTQEVGEDKALALLSKSLGGFGAMMGKMTKEQMGITELDVKTTSSFMKEMNESLGFTTEIEENPTTVTVKNVKCPVYEGLKGAGYDHEDIEKFCRNGSAVMMNALFEQMDPKVRYALKKFRSTPDDFCEEEIAFT